MDFEKIDINKLVPAYYNPRKDLTPNDDEYIKIKRSIAEFGYVEPIVVNKDNTIISGHQRLKVLKDLGYKEIEIVRIDVSKEKEMALNVALNKIDGDWDLDKLSDVLEDLKSADFDITLTGFDEVIKLDFDDEDFEYKENERERTNNAYNLELFDKERCDGKYEMPIIENDGFIPTDLIGFNYAKTSKEKNCGIHFYIDDYQFERIWNNPQEYEETLGEYECILSPDFSLYRDMPMSMKIWNVYRSRLIGQYYQDRGIKVIPTLSWCEKETFEFCFDGIPEGSIVSISTIGVKRDSEAMQIWKDGVDEMIKRIKPSCIVVYGGKLDYDYGDIEVIYFENKVTERMAGV